MTLGPPSKAARFYAATRAALDDNGQPSFGVRIVQPGDLPLRDRIGDAYNDPSKYPMPDPRNWLSQLAGMDPKNLPKHVQNYLVSMIHGAVQDPMSAVLPFMGGAKGAGGLARAALVSEEGAAGAAELSQKMQGVNQYLEQKKTPFAAGLDPLPSRAAPIKEYATENVGPRQVNVTGEKVMPPERITPEQAQAAGVHGPVPYETPQFRFTRQGPRVEVTGNAPVNTHVSIKVPKSVHSELGLDDGLLTSQAYPSLKLDGKGNATVSPADLKYMVDDAATRADPTSGFETAAHRRKALREWAAANKVK